MTYKEKRNDTLSPFVLNLGSTHAFEAQEVNRGSNIDSMVSLINRNFLTKIISIYLTQEKLSSTNDVLH